MSCYPGSVEFVGDRIESFAGLVVHDTDADKVDGLSILMEFTVVEKLRH
jgi:hypothetical protein